MPDFQVHDYCKDCRCHDCQKGVKCRDFQCNGLCASYTEKGESPCRILICTGYENPELSCIAKEVS